MLYNIEKIKGEFYMQKSKKRGISFICLVLSMMMVLSSGVMQVEAKEKKAKFNKQYSGKLNGEHSYTYDLKVPADGTFYIQYSSKGDYTKVDTLSDYKGTGFFIPRIYTKNKTVKTKSKKVKKGDVLTVNVYVQRPPMKASYKIKFCYKKSKSKKKKSSTKVYQSTFSKKYKTTPIIRDIKISKGKCTVKGSFELINKKYEPIKKYPYKKRVYKTSKNFSVYMNDETEFKLSKSQWNTQIKNISNSNMAVLLYVKNNKLTKLVFHP